MPRSKTGASFTGKPFALASPRTSLVIIRHAKGGRGLPKRRWPPAPSQRTVMNVRVRSGNEGLQQRMRLVRLAAELGMKLRGDEERVVGQFDHLDQLAVG